jgi:hypothetical protein
MIEFAELDRCGPDHPVVEARTQDINGTRISLDCLVTPSSAAPAHQE